MTSIFNSINSNFNFQYFLIQIQNTLFDNTYFPK